MIKTYTGDCLEQLKHLEDNSIDSIVTDPPYGLSDHSEKDVVNCMAAWLAGEPYMSSKKGFMGKTWDSWVPGPEIWREAYRVLKPGAYMIVFASTRTDDLMSMAIRLAGFRKHPAGMWCFGSGFPKAANLSKAFDKVAGVERTEGAREWKGGARSGGISHGGGQTGTTTTLIKYDTPATDVAKQYDGWYYGLQSLKPAFEPWLMFQKPHEGNMTDNVLKYGTGAINIDACRVAINAEVDDSRLGGKGTWSSEKMAKNVYEGGYSGEVVGSSTLGRWPSNFIHDGSDEVVELFPDSKGQQGDVKGTELSRTGGENTNCYGEYGRVPSNKRVETDKSAARFFYCAKASKTDRNEGCDNNTHPTVKPTSLMQYLCKLITPIGGTVLDPFMGSGSTGKAATLEGFSFIGIDMEEHYVDISEKRIEYVEEKMKMQNKQIPLDDFFE